MLIKQAHFFWGSRPNKRASTFPIQVRMTAQHNGAVSRRSLFSRRQVTDSVENVQTSRGGREKTIVLSASVGTAWYAARAFQHICWTQFLPLLHLQITFQANSRRHEGGGAIILRGWQRAEVEEYKRGMKKKWCNQCWRDWKEVMRSCSDWMSACLCYKC